MLVYKLREVQLPHLSSISWNIVPTRTRSLIVEKEAARTEYKEGELREAASTYAVNKRTLNRDPGNWR